jgi:hypothetical protein
VSEQQPVRPVENGERVIGSLNIDGFFERIATMVENAETIEQAGEPRD